MTPLAAAFAYVLLTAAPERGSPAPGGDHDRHLCDLRIDTNEEDPR